MRFAIRYEFGTRRESFLQYMKSCGATPAILLSMLVSESIDTVHPDTDLPIACSMAIDFREEIGLPNTHKNCVGSVYLPFIEETQEMEDSQRAHIYREMLSEQRTPDALRSLANKQIGLCHKLDQLSTLEQKRKALSFFNDMYTDTYSFLTKYRHATSVSIKQESCMLRNLNQCINKLLRYMLSAIWGRWSWANAKNLWIPSIFITAA